jgi:hypothetical protein
MMSPKYWNLPKPGLIISITGSAQDFKPDQALSADDVPYVMFSLFNLKQPENKIFVPVRKSDYLSDPVRKSDCLSDVLFRLSDFSACWVAAAATAAEAAKDTNLTEVNAGSQVSDGKLRSSAAADAAAADANGAAAAIGDDASDSRFSRLVVLFAILVSFQCRTC